MSQCQRFRVIAAIGGHSHATAAAIRQSVAAYWAPPLALLLTTKPGGILACWPYHIITHPRGNVLVMSD